jgi:enterochelin esterase-like enzyme
VLYLLDGQEYLQFTAAIADFLAEDDRIPRLIIVAIDSGDFKQRAHDLTIPSQADIDNRSRAYGTGQAPSSYDSPVYNSLHSWR